MQSHREVHTFQGSHMVFQDDIPQRNLFLYDHYIRKRANEVVILQQVLTPYLAMDSTMIPSVRPNKAPKTIGGMLVTEEWSYGCIHDREWGLKISYNAPAGTAHDSAIEVKPNLSIRANINCAAELHFVSGLKAGNDYVNCLLWPFAKKCNLTRRGRNCLQLADYIPWTDTPIALSCQSA